MHRTLKILVMAALVINSLSLTAKADEGTYVCRPTSVVGFIYRENRTQWEPAEFTDSIGLSISRSIDEAGEQVWTFSSGTLNPKFSICEVRYGNDSAIVFCETLLVEFFSMRLEDKKFQYYYPGGYLTDPKFGNPHIAIGDCEN